MAFAHDNSMAPTGEINSRVELELPKAFSFLLFHLLALSGGKFNLFKKHLLSDGLHREMPVIWVSSFSSLLIFFFGFLLFSFFYYF